MRPTKRVVKFSVIGKSTAASMCLRSKSPTLASTYPPSSLPGRLGVTSIYVTHDQTEALTFADQVVVMHDGHVVQIGTPQELFERPGHTFVGYFIGSPGMNFIPVEVSGGTAKIGNVTIKLPSNYQTESKNKVELGIRPEFLSLSRTNSGNSIPVIIKRIEDIGRHKIVRTYYAGHALNVIVAENEPVSNEYTYLSFDSEQINVYANDWLVNREGES